MMMKRVPRATPVHAAFLAAALAVTCGSPARLHAQLPAPPVSSPEPLRVGAYGGVVVGRFSRGDQGRETGVSQANAALLVSGTLTRRLSYFGELEAASTTRENWTGREEDDALELERLYAEYAFSDGLRLRAGRFLTPVGQWNEIHAGPLTWTAHRPLSSYRPFAKSLNGVMAAGQVALGSRDAGWTAYATVPGTEFEEREESAFLRAVGGRAAVELMPGFFVGGSASSFRASRPEGPSDDDGEEREDDQEHEAGEVRETPGSRTLLGVDLLWRFGRAELLAEAVDLSAASGSPSERGAFVQLAVPLPGSPLHLVGRIERYDPVVERRLGIQTLGVVYRPDRRLVVKLERQHTDRPSFRVPDGWYLSVSGIF